jgi:uncharacterized protein (DUF4415 family)
VKRGSRGRDKGGGRGSRTRAESPPAAVSVDTAWVERAAIAVPEVKQAISFRVDPDVLGFFKAQGPRYQTRMNAVLRAYVTAHGGEEK